MRAMLPSILIPILLLGVTPALAQLPPEILADAHLLRAEQALRDGDKDRARAEIDKIILLQKEHELDLVEEFHFRLAKAAGMVDLLEQALESVTKYLTATGRDGPHYVEALELMNQAQDEIAGRTEPQADPLGPPPPAHSGAGKTPEVQTENRDLLNAAATTEAQPAPECELWAWNTADYFRTATIQSVKACLGAGADPNARDPSKKTPLHRAAWFNGNPAVVQALLGAGADPNARSMWKVTPLHDAAGRNENPAVTQALLAGGADPSARDQDKQTPLHRAAWSNENPEVIQALLAGGADPMARDTFNITPLHTAARNENLAAIEALLAVGADPNARNKGNGTPLHSAAWSNENPAVSEALLAGGADPMARRSDKKTPLDLAKKKDNLAVIEILRHPTAGRERQLAEARARRKDKSGPGFLEAAIGIVGGTAIAAAAGGARKPSRPERFSQKGSSVASLLWEAPPVPPVLIRRAV